MKEPQGLHPHFTIILQLTMEGDKVENGASAQIGAFHLLDRFQVHLKIPNSNRFPENPTTIPLPLYLQRSLKSKKKHPPKQLTKAKDLLLSPTRESSRQLPTKMTTKKMMTQKKHMILTTLMTQARLRPHHRQMMRTVKKELKKRRREINHNKKLEKRKQHHHHQPLPLPPAKE